MVGARTRFPQAIDLQSFRLSVQQNATSTVSQRGFALKLFEWLMDGRADDAGLRYSRARIQLEGGLRDVVFLQAALEGQFPNMIVRELNVSTASAIHGPDDSIISMSLVADFYFRPAPADVGGSESRPSDAL
jgi:hypothetical protein